MQGYARILLIAGLALVIPLVAAEKPANLLPANPAAWKPFAPRPQNAPAGAVIPAAEPGGSYELTLASGGKPFVYGGWRYRVENIQPGACYRFRARALPAAVKSVRESVTVQLRWSGDFGTEVAPSYIWDSHRVKALEETIEFDGVVQAPAKARAVDIELLLQWTPLGKVRWQPISFTQVLAPRARKVRVAAVWLRPRNSATPADSVEAFAKFAGQVAAEQHPDVILMGEMINHIGAPGDFDSKAEPIPGPTTERMAEVAAKNNLYVAFSVVEREGQNLFNTGVLIDRRGRIVGKYRKVQLPFEEVAHGIAPGDSFPVFSTDFGRVGMMICHDASFAEPARELALNGAELILVPIWGGRPPLVRARAIENGVYLATSGYDYDSEIVDPRGQLLASVKHDQGPGVAVADIDLSQRFPEDWIGEWRDTVSKQRRDGPYRFRQP